MSQRFPRAALNKRLLILLGLAIVGTAAFWIIRSRGDDVAVAATEATIYCSKCGPIRMPSQKVNSIQWDVQFRLKCPTCGEFKASFSQTGDAVEMMERKP